MVRLMSRLDAPVEEFDLRGQRKRMTWLSDRSPSLGTGPEAFYSETLDPDAETRAHFHRVDQFQVFIEGGQRLGSEAIEPVTLHYADAHTPYGPIVGRGGGVHYLTYRARRDPGALFMPESRPQRRYLGGRHMSVRVASEPNEDAEWTVLIERQADGLEAAAVVAGPAATITSRGPAEGAGCAYVVARGSLRRDGRDHPPLSSIFVAPGEDVAELEAGPDGVTLLALTFPAIGADGRPNSGVDDVTG